MHSLMDIVIKCLFVFQVIFIMHINVINSEEPPTTDKIASDEIPFDNRTKIDIGTLNKIIEEVKNIPPLKAGKRFRTPCRTGNHCGKIITRLMVPKLTQLENTIMGIMKDIAKLPPGARIPDKYTKTEPAKLILDRNYKEDECNDKIEVCLKEDKRRRRVLKKLFFKKYNSIRQDLIGYGGRRLWGGEGNLFYKK